MKRTLFYIAGIAVLVSACAKEVENSETKNEIANGKESITILASLPETKSTAAIDGDVASYSWQLTDVISVVEQDATSGTDFTLKNADAATAGAFSGTKSDGKDLVFAVTPSSVLTSALEDGGSILYDITLPTTYSNYIPGTTNAVMVGTPNGVSGDNYKFEFRHIAALMKVTYVNVPIGTAGMYLTTDQNINGTWSNIDNTTPELTIQANGTQTTYLELAEPVSVANQTMDFYVPVPTGDYSSFTIALYDANGDDIAGTKKKKTTSTSLHKADLFATPSIPLSKTFFEERFSQSTGTMGWSGSTCNGTFYAENSWTVDNAYGAGGAAKFGTGSSLGSATTPSINITPDVYQTLNIKLSFKAGAWDGNKESTKLVISSTNCKVNGANSTSVDMTKGEWTEYILDVTNITGAITITFEGNSSNNSRFLLDDVCVYYGSKPVELPTPGLAFSSASSEAYLGESASFEEPTLTNSNSVLVSYESSNTAVAEVASDGQVTLKSAGTATIRASFAGNSTYKAQTVSYELTVKTPTLSITPTEDILMGGSANSIYSINITATHAWTATLNEDATTARGTKFSVLDNNDNVIEGAITGTEGSTSIKFKALVAGDESAVSDYGTITFIDNLYADCHTDAINIKQSAKGENVVYTLTPAKGSNNSYAGNCDITINLITWNVSGNAQMVPWRIGGKNISDTDRQVYSKTDLSNNVSKIEITHGAANSITVNSMTVTVSKNSDFSSPVSTLTPTFVANSTVTVNRPDGKDWSNCYYKINYNVTVSGDNNKFLEFSEAKFYE